MMSRLINPVDHFFDVDDESIRILAVNKQERVLLCLRPYGAVRAVKMDENNIITETQNVIVTN